MLCGIATINPPTVVSKATEIPSAKSAGSERPVIEMEEKTERIPKTVPNSPKSGEIVAIIFIVFIPVSMELMLAFSSSLMSSRMTFLLSNEISLEFMEEIISSKI